MRTADVARVRGEPRVQKTELDRVLARVAALEEGLARRDAVIHKQRDEIERLQAENGRLLSERSDLHQQLGQVQGLLVAARKQLEQQGLKLAELERRVGLNSRKLVEAAVHRRAAGRATGPREVEEGYAEAGRSGRPRGQGAGSLARGGCERVLRPSARHGRVLWQAFGRGRP